MHLSYIVLSYSELIVKSRLF